MSFKQGQNVRAWYIENRNEWFYFGTWNSPNSWWYGPIQGKLKKVVKGSRIFERELLKELL